MKLATLRDGTRDGQLIVVSRDLRRAHVADGIAPTLQRVLDDWRFLAPQLEDLQHALESGTARHAFDFDPARCMAPLPRAFRRMSADAWPLHGALRDGGADRLHGPREALSLPEDTGTPHVEPGLAAVIDDLPMGASPARAAGAIRLLLLGADWRLAGRPDDPDDDFRSRPATVLAPVAITPDEAGTAWRDGRLHAALTMRAGGRETRWPDMGAGMAAGLPALLSLAARTRPLRAGGLLWAGPIRAATQDATDSVEGKAPGAMRFGDHLELEAVDAHGRSLFGAIDQPVHEAEPDAD